MCVVANKSLSLSLLKHSVLVISHAKSNHTVLYKSAIANLYIRHLPLKHKLDLADLPESLQMIFPPKCRVKDGIKF